MNYPATDPSEWVGTPEYEEVQHDLRLKQQQLLEMMEEDRLYSQLQYPYRHSH